MPEVEMPFIVQSTLIPLSFLRDVEMIMGFPLRHRQVRTCMILTINVIRNLKLNHPKGLWSIKQKVIT